MVESPEFLQVKQQGEIRKLPLGEVLKVMPGRVFHLVAIIMLAGTSSYMLFVWMPTYLSKIVVPPVEQALMINYLAILSIISFIALFVLKTTDPVKAGR